MITKKVTVYMVLKVDNRRYADVCTFDVPENFDVPSYKTAAIKIDWLINKLFSTIKRKTFLYANDLLRTAPDEIKNAISTIDDSIDELIKANRIIYGADDDEPYLKKDIPLTGFQIPKWGKDNPRD